MDGFIKSCFEVGFYNVKDIKNLTLREFDILLSTHRSKSKEMFKEDLYKMFLNERIIQSVDKDNKYVVKDFDDLINRVLNEESQHELEMIKQIKADKKRLEIEKYRENYQ